MMLWTGTGPPGAELADVKAQPENQAISRGLTAASGAVLTALGVAGRAHTGKVRITLWVRPGSAHPGVGGEHDGALVVRVSERAVDGRATAAALAAVAGAFGVRRHAVTLVSGTSSRTKIVDVAGPISLCSNGFCDPDWTKTGTADLARFAA